MELFEVWQVPNGSNHSFHITMTIKTCAAALATSIIVFSLPNSAEAAKGDGARRAAKGDRQRPAMQLNRFDRDQNGRIDGKESEALRRNFERMKDHPILKLDSNHDGSLSDAEIAAAKIPEGAPARKARGERKKKKSA